MMMDSRADALVVLVCVALARVHLDGLTQNSFNMLPSADYISKW